VKTWHFLTFVEIAITHSQNKKLNKYKAMTYFKFVQNMVKIGSANRVSEVNICYRNRPGQNIHHLWIEPKHKPCARPMPNKYSSY